MLLLFGKTEGSALMRDYEEMKAHNVGLELMKREARDKQRPLSEHFIRELNHTILVGDFYKTSRDGDYRYKIHVGVYKTRPNSVITPSGEMFDYAMPEETPALMTDLITWYREEEKKAKLSVIELAALFHYRYIRIHPFEDGNGRIARLLVNYILHRHGYPMIVVPTTDRNNYLDILGKCDKITGSLPFDGENATKEQIAPLTDYIANLVEKKLHLVIAYAKGEIMSFSEVNVVDSVPNKTFDNQDTKTEQHRIVPDNVPKNELEKIMFQRHKLVIGFIRMNNKISATEIADLLKVSSKTIKRDLQQLKNKGIIERIGSSKSGYWKIS
jgi:Fic family protein